MKGKFPFAKKIIPVHHPGVHLTVFSKGRKHGCLQGKDASSILVWRYTFNSCNFNVLPLSAFANYKLPLSSWFPPLFPNNLLPFSQIS